MTGADGGRPNMRPAETPSSQFDIAGRRPIAEPAQTGGQSGFIHNWYGINARDQSGASEQRTPFYVLPQQHANIIKWRALRRLDNPRFVELGSTVAVFDGQWSFDGVAGRINARHFDERTNMLMLGGNVEGHPVTETPQSFNDWRADYHRPRWRVWGNN